MSEHRRVAYLEAVRGIAAVQVCAYHFMATYNPAVAFAKPTIADVPSFVRTLSAYLYDGNAAVLIFFSLSGYVLTVSFTRPPQGMFAQLAGRLVRIGVPVVFAGLFGWVMYLVFGGYHGAAAAITGSTRLAGLWRPAPGVLNALRDIFVNGLFLGYRETSYLSLTPIGGALRPLTTALNGPLWTMSIELQGSLLLMILVALRRARPRLWAGAVVLSVMILFRSNYVCFVIGHLCAVYNLAEGKPKMPAVFAAALLIAGVALCLAAQFKPLLPFSLLARAALPWALPNPDAHTLTRYVGSCLAFIGAIQCAPLRAVLSRAAPAWLGRMSFPLYLTHWPIAFGLSAWVVVAVQPQLGAGLAIGLAVAIGAAASLMLAYVFLAIDQRVIVASRQVRRYLATRGTLFPQAAA